MLSFRLLTLLLVFFSSTLSSTEKATVSPTISLSTITPRPCGVSTKAFIRKKGYWCSASLTIFVDKQISYKRAKDSCELNGYVLSSLETEEEWNYYYNAAKAETRVNITSIWMGVGYNNSTQKYYWNDGNAIETLEPQPTVVKANGNTAWFLDEGLNKPGKRILKVVNSAEEAGSVKQFICGRPGPQFT
uniref:C-type lectin domain-containing protein n=1 Tax=Caenorhabditis tropicalis TaxID=1561998 RepID=A0A1I7V475_9PELO